MGVSGNGETGIGGSNALRKRIGGNDRTEEGHGDRRRCRGGRNTILWKREVDFSGGNADAALMDIFFVE